MIGTTVSHYTITEKIGEGGMGVVFKAHDVLLDRDVALKFLPQHLTTNEEDKKRFIHEAKAASALQHNNICTIHEINETNPDASSSEDSQIFICMDHYSGETLDKINKPFELKKAVDIALQISRGLSKAHQKNIIHRDIKPANIMITDDGVVKILDFGLAKLSSKTHLTQEGKVLGTAAYMSPEQAQGAEIDYRTDIWSFGVVLYEMLSGNYPFKGDYDQAIIYSIINEKPLPLKELREDIPDELFYILDRCLEKKAMDRFDSVDEIIKILQQFQSAETSAKISYKRKNKKSIIYSASFLLVILISWITWELFFALPAEKHIAILPFTNVGEIEKNQIYCDGLLEIITSRLTQLQSQDNSLWIVPASEIRKYNINSAEEAYKKYNSNLVISGSIEKKEQYLRIILNLIDAKSFLQLKSDDLEITNEEIASSLEGQVIKSIVQMIDLDQQSTLQADFFAGGTKSSDAYDYYIQGRGYLQRYENEDNLNTAVSLFKKSLDIDTFFTLAWAGLADAYWKKYDKTRDTSFVKPAIKACDKAINQNKNYAEVYITSGIINLGIGKYEKALDELNKALKIDSLSGKIYWNLGRAYQLIGDSESAFKAYNKAIEKRPSCWQGYNRLGYYYYSNGKFEKAIEQYKKVIELIPYGEIGYRNLAAMYFYLDQFEKAVNAGEKALENEPDYRSYNNLAGYYYYAGKYKESVKMYVEALKMNKNDYRIWGSLANSYYYSGLKDSARVCYQTAIDLAEQEYKINPRNMHLLCNLAGYYVELDENEKALKLLTQIEKTNPSEPDILFSIGDSYEQLGKREEALKWMEKAIKKGFTLAKFRSNPAIQELIADRRFQEFLEKESKFNAF